MAEITGTTFTEIPSYAFDALIADIGGSLGLVLGLSLIGKKINFVKFVKILSDMLFIGRKLFQTKTTRKLRRLIKVNF